MAENNNNDLSMGLKELKALIGISLLNSIISMGETNLRLFGISKAKLIENNALNLEFNSCFTSKEEGYYHRICMLPSYAKIFNKIQCKIEISKSIDNYIESTFNIYIPKNNTDTTKTIKILNLSDNFSIIKYISYYIHHARLLYLKEIIEKILIFGNNINK